jgi:Phage integrase family
MNGLKRKTPGCCGNHLSVQRGERPFSPWAKSAPSMASRSTWIPCPRRRLLSREELARLIDAALTPYHRTLLMTLYATGVRRAELTHLKVSDIDSKRMVIHVQRPQARTWAVPSSATLQRDRGTPKRWGSSQAMDLTCTTRPGDATAALPAGAEFSGLSTMALRIADHEPSEGFRLGSPTWYSFMDPFTLAG